MFNRELIIRFLLRRPAALESRTARFAVLALAAIGVALELGVKDEVIKTGFAKFGGVKRRFTKVGEVGGAIVIDDYGHHPVEIRAVLSAAREGAQGRVIAVVQPHRFTRLRDLMDEFQQAFNDADDRGDLTGGEPAVPIISVMR